MSHLNCSNDHQKLRIVQGGMLVAAREIWMKIKANVLNRRIIIVVARLKNML